MNEEKQRRMELRKATGTREISGPSKPSFHRGTVYAMSFVCFACRKSFKRHFDVDPSQYPSEIECSECGDTSYNLGRNFKAPKRSDDSQWKKVEFLVEHGFRFQKIRIGPNHYDTVAYPKTLEEAKEFVRNYKQYAIKPRST